MTKPVLRYGVKPGGADFDVVLPNGDRRERKNALIVSFRLLFHAGCCVDGDYRSSCYRSAGRVFHRPGDSSSDLGEKAIGGKKRRQCDK